MLSLDDKDLDILGVLQRDATLSAQQVADRVGLSLSPSWRRIKRLREEGVIQATVALVDPAKVGLKMTAFASVTLSNHAEETVRDFDRALESWPEVMEAHKVTGDRDYLLRILVPDIEAYEDFLSHKLLPHPAIAGVSSRFSLKRLKAKTVLPL